MEPLGRRSGYLVAETAKPDARKVAVGQAGHKEDREQCSSRSTPLPALRGLRQSGGLTQRELVGLAGVSRGTVYRLENGLRGSYPRTQRKLAMALKVLPEELVRGHRLK